MARCLQRGREILKPLKWYRDLALAKHRAGEGLFLAEGRRVIGQLLATDPEGVVELLTEAGTEHGLRCDRPVRELDKRQFASVCRTLTPQGVAAVCRIPPDFRSSRLPSGGGNILFCEDIQDPGNVGTLLRTAAAFDFRGAVLTDRCADPFSPKCVQASAGALYSLWIRRTGDTAALLRELKSRGTVVAAADMDGRGTVASMRTGHTVLALGNEGAGLSAGTLALADTTFAVPINGRNVESLNVASCGAICMYLIARGG